MKRILVIIGTRPEAIKLAPLVHQLRARPDADVVVCATGQHREMLADALAAFDLSADIDLDVMTCGQHPSEVLGRLLIALRQVLVNERWDALVVQGDTMSVHAGAMAGFLHGVPTAHVEAGLRTYDNSAPFPEEVNRRVATIVADYHFAPTPEAVANLRREHVAPDRIYQVGNTGVDALHWMRARVGGRPLPPELDPGDRRLILVTAHRRESFGAPLRALCQGLRRIAERHADVELIYPVHLNPQVQQPAREVLGDCPRVRLTPPLDYPQFVGLLDRAHAVITDSGGVQEEAAALGKPTLIVRDKTERPEVVRAGVAALVGADAARIAAAVDRLLSDPDAYAAMARPVHVIGDGQASERIVQTLIDGVMTTPPFQPALHAEPVASATEG